MADIFDTKDLQLSVIGFWALLKDLGEGDLHRGQMLAQTAFSPQLAKRQEDAAHKAVRHLVEHHGVSQPQAMNLMAAVLQAIQMDPLSSGMSFLLRAAWYHYGQPTMVVGHKLAASYMATKLAIDVVDSIESPFPVFMLDLPTDMLHIYDDMQGNNVALTKVLVGRIPDATGAMGWGYIAQTDGMANIWLRQQTLSKLLAPNIAGNEAAKQVAFSLELASEEKRSAELLGRLLVSCMLHMTEGGKVQKIGKGHNYSATRRNGDEPTRRVFQLQRDVKHDVRQAVQSYLRGDVRTLSVQTLVAGYWRQQPHGPKSSLRRSQFIEPAWRGPEDAPIAARRHVLT